MSSVTEAFCVILICLYVSVATLNDEDYAMLYWPKLNDAVLLILQQKPGQFIPISYEEMYRFVDIKTKKVLIGV